MNEPLFWNPLPEAAKWLSEKTGRPFDARALIDLIAGSGKRQGDPTPTIINAALPSNYRYATIHRGDPKLSGKKKDESLNKMLTNLFGKLPSQYVYISWNFIPDLKVVSSCPLPDYELLQLLVHGRIGISRLYHPNLGVYEQVWLMPYGSEYEATIETCGINRDDLIALGDRLVKEYAPELPKYELRADGSPVKWAIRALELANNIWLDNLQEQKKITKRQLGHKIYGVLKKESYRNNRNEVVSLESIAKFLNDWNEPELK